MSESKSVWTAAEEAQWVELSARRARIRDENVDRLRGVLARINDDVMASDGTSCGLGDTDVWAEALAVNANALHEVLAPFVKAKA